MSHTRHGDAIKRMRISSEEIDMIEGCLLGDGTLSRSGKQYRLRIEHASEARQYVEWKYERLKRLCDSDLQYIAEHDSYRFGTVGHPEITELRRRWYHPEKRIANDLKLTPMMLAIWFMDDGTKHRDTVDLSVHSFSKTGLEPLRDQLRSFGIETTVNSDSKGNRLYVIKKSYSSFKTLVKPYIVDCMAYKLP